MTDWRDDLLYTGGKVPKLRAVVANAITILRHDDRWLGVLAYDEMRERPVYRSPPPWHAHDGARPSDGIRLGDVTDDDITRTVSWFCRAHALDMRAQTIAEAIAVVAGANPYHPVREYLDGLEWDGEPRLDAWLHRYVGADANEYTAAVGARWMIGAVARVYDPGCKLDNVCVLEGLQGTRKSTVVRILARRPEWFYDSDLVIGDKDAPQALTGKWLVEFGELHALSRAAITQIKAFVSRQVDTYRPSYGRTARDYPRRWAAIGTTNADAYLTDPTGNRRWWPVRTTSIGIAALERDADQLWAEARVRYQAGETWHVDSAELAKLCADEQAERVQGDPWDEPIAAWLATPSVKIDLARMGYVTTAKVLADALRIEPGRQTRTDEMRAAEALVRIGWAKGARRRVHGARVYPFIAPLREVGPDVGPQVGTSIEPSNTDGSYPCPYRPNLNSHAHTTDDQDLDQDQDRDRDLGFVRTAGQDGTVGTARSK